MYASFVTGEDPVNAYYPLYTGIRIALISPFNTTHYTVITPPTALCNNTFRIYSSYSTVYLILLSLYDMWLQVLCQLFFCPNSMYTEYNRPAKHHSSEKQKKRTNQMISSLLPSSWQWPTLPRKEYAVPSALEDLTSVFGMGTGVTPPPLSPGSIHFKKTFRFPQNYSMYNVPTLL